MSLSVYPSVCPRLTQIPKGLSSIPPKVEIKFLRTLYSTFLKYIIQNTTFLANLFVFSQFIRLFDGTIFPMGLSPYVSLTNGGFVKLYL